MNKASYLLLLMFFGITSNLGFFTIPAFLILTFIAVFLILELFSFKIAQDITDSSQASLLPFFLTTVLFFSGIYYGGLYQFPNSLAIGYFIFYGVLFLVIVMMKVRMKGNYVYAIIYGGFIALSFWTLINSPSPRVDTFVLFKEAPLSLLQMKNPYSLLYSEVYPGIKNYFPYLPLSLFYVLPFLVVFADPRVAIIFAQVVSALLLSKFLSFSKIKEYSGLIILTFLFLPRSFYMIEHMYLDTIVFSFFLLALYLGIKKKMALFSLTLGVMFSFKIHLIFLLLPIFLTSEYLKILFQKRNAILFILPFSLPLFFYGTAFKDFWGILMRLSPGSSNIGPSAMNLSFVNFLNIFIFPYFPQIPNIGILIGGVIFVILYFYVIRSTLSLPKKIFMTLFFFQYFTYISFFNHYYFAALFLFFISMPKLEESVRIKQ